jgi:hypothetical protein
VAGDEDACADVLESLFYAVSQSRRSLSDGFDGPSRAPARARGAPPPAAQPARAGGFGERPGGYGKAASFVAEGGSAHALLAQAASEQLGLAPADAAGLVREAPPLRLGAALCRADGAGGDPAAAVRFLKWAFAHAAKLVGLATAPGGPGCPANVAGARGDPTDAAGACVAHVCACVGAGLGALDAEVAAWAARALYRLGSEARAQGHASSLWHWFAGDVGGTEPGGCALLLAALKRQPDLHAAGGLLPLVVVFAGGHLSEVGAGGPGGWVCWVRGLGVRAR